MMRIAVLDNDQNQSQLIAQVFGMAGFTCKQYALGQSLMVDLRRESFDAVLLAETGLPDATGLGVLRWVRQHHDRRLPIILITARDAESDAIEAFEAGADDYICGPLRLGELVARTRALLRRAAPGNLEEQVFSYDRFRFNLRTLQAWNNERATDLTQKEFRLAVLLMRNIGRPLSRSHILEAVWGRGSDVPSRTMDTHVSRVRANLELRPEGGYLLAPVYSYGYRLERLTAASNPQTAASAA